MIYVPRASLLLYKVADNYAEDKISVRDQVNALVWATLAKQATMNMQPTKDDLLAAALLNSKAKSVAVKTTSIGAPAQHFYCHFLPDKWQPEARERKPLPSRNASSGWLESVFVFARF